MTNANTGRVDSASRIVKASPSAVYEAFMDPEALVSWLPPEGMKGRIEAFDAREGGTYRMVLTYVDVDRQTPGKTTDDTDVASGTFLKLVENRQIVQRVEFDSEDPAFSGAMIMSWTLSAVPEGTEVVIVCENVPAGIRQEDHEEGLGSTLANLAAFVE